MGFRSLSCRCDQALGTCARGRPRRGGHGGATYDHGERAVPRTARADALLRCRRALCRARPAGAHDRRQGSRVQFLFDVGHVSRAASAAHADRARADRGAGRRPDPADAAEPVRAAGLAFAGGRDGMHDRLAFGVGDGGGAREGRARQLCRGVAERAPPLVRFRDAESRQQPRDQAVRQHGLYSCRHGVRVGLAHARICLRRLRVCASGRCSGSERGCRAVAQAEWELAQRVRCVDRVRTAETCERDMDDAVRSDRARPCV